jgi:exodeoxyribonuclease VII small subunit
VASRDGSAAGRGAGSGAERPTPDGVSRMPYEQARDELTELVSRLEAGGLSLAESLQLWERGEELAAICEEWLEGARARLAAALARQDKPSDAPGAPF